MFNFLKKKKNPITALDKFILTIYGDPPPAKTANLNESIEIAFRDILKQTIIKSEISKIATPLYTGKIPYSTNDLALSIALNFFKRPELKSRLSNIQFDARKNVKLWLQQNLINKYLAESFEYTLNKIFDPK